MGGDAGGWKVSGDGCYSVEMLVEHVSWYLSRATAGHYRRRANKGRAHLQVSGRKKAVKGVGGGIHLLPRVASVLCKRVAWVLHHEKAVI